MPSILRERLKSANVMIAYGESSGAITALNDALKLTPEPALVVKKAILSAKDHLKHRQPLKAAELIGAILSDAKRFNGDHNTYARPLTAALLPVVYYSIRGGLKLKPEGGVVRIPCEIGAQQPQHILFLKSGNPIAIALCYHIEKNTGDWVISYSNVQWLHD